MTLRHRMERIRGEFAPAVQRTMEMVRRGPRRARNLTQHANDLWRASIEKGRREQPRQEQTPSRGLGFER